MKRYKGAFVLLLVENYQISVMFELELGLSTTYGNVLVGFHMCMGPPLVTLLMFSALFCILMTFLLLTTVDIP